MITLKSEENYPSDNRERVSLWKKKMQQKKLNPFATFNLPVYLFQKDKRG